MPPDLSAAVALEVARLLEERGWSARELARRTGLSQVTLSRKLKGPKVSVFTLDDVQMLCRAFDIEPAQLIEWAQHR